MARFRGFLILSVPFFGWFCSILTWVGGSFRPHRVVHRPTNPAVQRYVVAKKSKVAVGDLVYYAWPRRYPIEANLNAKYGDRAVVIDILPEDTSMKVKWQGNNDGHIGFILSEAMKKETKADTVFLLMDADRDGILRKEEVEHLFPKEFKMLDLDADGRLDRGEWDLGPVKLPAEFYVKLESVLKIPELVLGSAA